METFDFNLAGGVQKWTPLHLAGHIGHYKIVEEILSGSLEQLQSFPINVYARNTDTRTPRQCTKGNLVLTKIFRKAEKRYLKEIFETENAGELEMLIASKGKPTKKDQQFEIKGNEMDGNFVSFMTIMKKVKFNKRHSYSKHHTVSAKLK